MKLKLSRRWYLLITVLLIALALLLSWMLISSPRVVLFGQIVSRFETERKVVVLTFDDGPLGANTTETLQLLDSVQAKATFFIVGKEALARSDNMKAIIAAGHAVGNHGYSHNALVFMAPSQLAREIELTDEVIKTAGYDGVIPFRPPYNYKLALLPLYLARHNRPDISRDVLVPEGSERTAEQIAADVVARVRPGSIILLHPHYDHTASTRAAIPLIVSQLRVKGYSFMTVPEMLEL